MTKTMTTKLVWGTGATGASVDCEDRSSEDLARVVDLDPNWTGIDDGSLVGEAWIGWSSAAEEDLDRDPAVRGYADSGDEDEDEDEDEGLTWAIVLVDEPADRAAAGDPAANRFDTREEAEDELPRLAAVFHSEPEEWTVKAFRKDGSLAYGR